MQRWRAEVYLFADEVGAGRQRATAQIDQRHVATCAKSSWVNVAAVARKLETHFERMYRQYRAGLPLEDLMVEHRAPAPHEASTAELCS
jgi:hypothetical protein